MTTLANNGPGSLRRALESAEDHWIVFDVEGSITLSSHIEIRSNKTVDGRGRDITVIGGIEINDGRNIILSDISMTNPLEGRCDQQGDVITVSGEGGADPDAYTSRDLWFHHLELYDGGDGLLDLRGASKVTISWAHLHNHKKAILAADTRSNQPATGMRVTFHHNFFDRLTLRGPQFLYGRAHYFNNYQKQFYEYGAGSLDGAELYSEGNIYEARPGSVCVPACPDPNPCGDNDFVVAKTALVYEWSANGPGKTQSVGDLALEGAQLNLNDPTGVFLPASEYAYVAEQASMALAATIAAEAGPRNDYCSGP